MSRLRVIIGGTALALLAAALPIAVMAYATGTARSVSNSNGCTTSPCAPCAVPTCPTTRRWLR
ncbi:hypothetical protein NMB32_07775 [Stenotrophomonas sp. CD2]|nr:hypothetical protein NMB32_07775 [Stenotrophomonas sp. CD2]